ncbi:hypothetical protein SAMN06269185_1732 [Natronoarchaeum philippinense]|uniref:Uncharacterized protein n=1 Tax=Natronoarchaeum philippinense TaxID=558529 RepID=A0A285NX16_NATPI|nr:hypothetical protein [Natronoarchaeum philippinense]SNZ12436.1 hypothetical protein SAMN06269185_1732 [Natronoarchaeum philippinense]
MYREATFALALLALLVGGAGTVAATPGDAGICVVGADTACTDDSASDDAVELHDSASSNDSAAVGICQIGVDSPCNGDAARSTETTTGSESAGHESGPVWGHESQHSNGHTDARFGGVQSLLSNSFLDTLFGGADSVSESTRATAENGSAGVCVIGADSPCNGGETRDSGSNSHSSSASHGESGQVWIPEDQNHDGEIDEEFRADSGASGSASTGSASTASIGGVLTAIFR